MLVTNYGSDIYGHNLAQLIKELDAVKKKYKGTYPIAKKNFCNDCLISRALIGSFLSPIWVQTDEILIYASFPLSAVKLSTFWPMKFYWLFQLPITKQKRLLTIRASFWIEFIHLFYGKLWVLVVHIELFIAVWFICQRVFCFGRKWWYSISGPGIGKLRSKIRYFEANCLP